MNTAEMYHYRDQVPETMVEIATRNNEVGADMDPGMRERSFQVSNKPVEIRIFLF